MPIDRDAIIKSQGHVLVMGGPGSGKTRVAIEKAAYEVRQGMLKPGQKILFLSFARATVARVMEVAQHLVKDEERKSIEIDTYHGFAWKLLRSHGYLLRAGSGMRILLPPMASARLAGLSRKEVDTRKATIFEEEGLLDFDLFAGKVACLLGKSRSLATMVSDVYPMIALDEFQDTNADEWAMIQELGKHSRLVALGDPDQRIYEFRGADPRRLKEYVDTYAPTVFDLGTENHRSNDTDIVEYGNDLLAGKNRVKQYQQVKVVRYGYYNGRDKHFCLKAAVLEAIERLRKSGEWSLAVLVPSKRLMLDVSDCLTATRDQLPSISHDVAVDVEGPSLAGEIVAGVMESESSEDEVRQWILTGLCDHIRGRSGTDKVSKAALEVSSAIADYVRTGTVRGSKRKAIVDDARSIARSRKSMVFSGESGEDWIKVRSLFENVGCDALRLVAEDVRYLRFFKKGTVLRAKLDEIWRVTGCYRGAKEALREALTQEHFSAPIRKWAGIHVMTIHKSKGKEFSEVIIYEGQYVGRILRGDATDRDRAQAVLSLRVAVTRAKNRSTILTPKNNVCPLL